MVCCIVSCVLMLGVPLLAAFVAWLKFVDADLTLLFKAKFGRSVDTLKGKVIWITGASSGIGEYLAYELSKVGARLALSGTNIENLNKVKENCLALGKSRGAEVLTVPFNICDFGCHEEQLKKVLDCYGKVCHLVLYGRLELKSHEVTEILRFPKALVCERFSAVFSVNHVMCRIFYTRTTMFIFPNYLLPPRLLPGAPFSATYTGSKHALQGYFECLRLEGVILGGLDVTLTCPGPVFSRVRERAFTAVPGQTYNMKDSPQSRLMQTDRCAQLIAVAIANKMDEVWISENPILLSMYLSQYMPSIFRNYIIKIFFTKERVMKLREGQ
ncbi:dehydrogenase, putative [Ixodes scapularis]|uniref:Dehydrogenase, putative n=1 Tax=Ixodes scapularis TaxID=6945 RepID=B7PCX0_IXOSC|nr:dehydrogenase, putative [Ixodes scapularis]|eukprot:XP_002410377.1 dehydrogenase, putative [Ixodes scapularis]